MWEPKWDPSSSPTFWETQTVACPSVLNVQKKLILGFECRLYQACMSLPSYKTDGSDFSKVQLWR